MARRLAVCLAFAVGSIAMTSRGARAGDVAAAAAHFEAGLADMLAGRYDTGCPALAESFRQDPRPGTLFTLAECENKRGKIASAIAHYQNYLITYDGLAPTARAEQRTRPEVSREAIVALTPRVPTLTVVLDRGWPAETTVTKDGVPIGAPSLGRALPSDPGDHEIAAVAPGFVPAKLSLRLAEGEHRELRVPASALVGPPSKPLADPDLGDGQRTAALVIGGVGVGALVVGIVGGSLALAAEPDIEEHCGADRICDSDAAKADAEAAQDKALVSTIGFVAAGALTATSLIVYFTAPSAEDPVALKLGARSVAGGAVVTGGFVW